MLRQLEVMGVDVSDRVISWGSLRQVKSLLLADATPFTGELAVTLDNPDGAFSTGGRSLFAGGRWYNSPVILRVDGAVVYEGLLKKPEPNELTNECVLNTENILRKPAETTVVTSGTKVNPGAAILAILRTAFTDELLDVRAILASGAPARAVGATVNYAFVYGSNTSVLSAAQAIASLAGISLFSIGSRITARVYQPYEGSEADLGPELNDEVARDWGTLSFDDTSFNNHVAVPYPGPNWFLLDDPVSEGRDGVTREYQFPDGEVIAGDFSSAAAFATMYLSRASFRRATISVATGPEFIREVLGNRFPVTNTRRNVSRWPMEAIELGLELDREEIELTLAGLVPAA